MMVSILLAGAAPGTTRQRRKANASWRGVKPAQHFGRDGGRARVRPAR